MGNELPGDDTKRPSIVFDADLLAEFDAQAEAEGSTRSAKLRELAEDYVTDHSGESPDESGLVPPDDPELAKAYQELRKLAGKRRDKYDRVTRETAVDSLYTNKTPKDTVFRKLLLPLQDRGYIRINAGMEKVWIYVN